MTPLSASCIAVAVLSILSASPAVGWACDCERWPLFEKNAPKYEVMVAGEVASYGERRSDGRFRSLTLRNLDLLKGELVESSLVLLGDRGADCRPTIDARRFVVGKTYIFLVPKNNRATQAWDGCGELWVRIENGEVVRQGIGAGMPHEYGMTPSEFFANMPEVHWTHSGLTPDRGAEGRSPSADDSEQPDETGAPRPNPVRHGRGAERGFANGRTVVGVAAVCFLTLLFVAYWRGRAKR